MSAHQPDDQKIATINTEYIEMDKLLKRENLTASGGEARYQISQGKVEVNGVLESRKRRKLYPGDIVRFNEVEIRVEKEQPLVSG